MKLSNSNRRAFPRMAAEVPVEIVRPDRIDGRTVRAMVQDLSQTGAMVITSEVIPPGEWIVLRPDRKGAGYGQEVTAVVERTLSTEEPQGKLVCRFPTPLDYATLQLFR